MAQPTIQTNFGSGEFAPKLRSRVDIPKYHSGASLMKNFFVDWAGGGASSRMGTAFVNQVLIAGARLIPFQPSATVSYVIEAGAGYMRFYANGAVIGAPFILSTPFLQGDLFPNAAAGNPGLKYCQDVTSMIICHPSYNPQILTIISPTNWTLTTINFGQTIASPTISSLTTTLAAMPNGWSYAYTVTAVDVNGQESVAPTPSTLLNFHSLSDTTNPGSNVLTWAAVPGAASYNVYKASPIFNTTFPASVAVGFIGNVLATSFVDATPGFAPNYALTPPIAENPFMGSGVQSYTVSVPGTYTQVPSIAVTGGGGSGATASASLSVTAFTLNSHDPGDDITIFSGHPNPNGSYITFNNGIVIQITNAVFQGSGGGLDGYNVNGFTLTNAGSITGAGTSTPGNPVHPVSCNASGFNSFGGSYDYNATWGVGSVSAISQGIGYTSVPTVTPTPAGATITAVLASASGGNPGVVAFYQQRLMLAAQQKNVQGFNLSQPGSFFNFNISNPIEADDAISGSIISEDLNYIRSLIAVPTGVIMLTGRSAWLLNGGGGLGAIAPVTPSNVTAFPQIFNGASDIRPLKVGQDILYVTNKGNYVRDLVYNIYMNIYTGTDITTLSNHLFYGRNIVDWAWAEEPYKTIWAVRDDGQCLSLAFVRDQEVMGWAHHDTSGQFKSVATVIETLPSGQTVDAVYFIVERLINGTVVQNVERMVDRYFTHGAEDCFAVDCGLMTAPAVNITTGNGNLSFLGDVSTVGNVVTLTDAVAAPFTAIMATNNWILRSNDGGIYKITARTSASVATASVVRPPTFFNPYFTAPATSANQAYNVKAYNIWTPLSGTILAAVPQLKNMNVVGLIDGTPFTATTNSNGDLTLPFSGSKIIVGLQFTPTLTTLPLDLGQPTVQSKRKKITGVTLRVADTLGLSVQSAAPGATPVPMKDFTVGNLNSTSDMLVTDLFSGDGRTILDPWWAEQAVYTITQTVPLPATILAVMPEVAPGDLAQ